MTRSQLSQLALATLAMFAFTQSADAQLGGLIKKKVKEAIKPPEKTNPAPQSAAAAPAPAPAAEPVSNSRDPFAGQRVPGNRALLITDEMIGRIDRGLDAEAVMLKDLEREIAAYPTPEKIQACKIKAAQTPEGQRLMNLGNFVKEGMTPEQVQAGMMKMSSESDAYYKKACPWDESKWSDSNRSEARTAIRTKAASKALPPSADPPAKSLASIGLDENDFGEMIERILQYCKLKKAMDVRPKTGGVKAPGEGQDIYWIYTESELKALQKFDCEGFKKKYANQLGAYA